MQKNIKKGLNGGEQDIQYEKNNLIATDAAITEEEYLRQYDPEIYESPSLTADILIFTINSQQKLELLLIRRAQHPFMGKWSIPGGFVAMDESVDAAAARKLKEKTGLEGIYLEQLYTFGEVDRDIRKRIVTVAYIALVPAKSLDIRAGDSASEIGLFEVRQSETELVFYSEDKALEINSDELAFDHKEIILKALERIKGKVTYTDIALELLKNKEKFSIYELQTIHEAITGEKEDIANFRRWFGKKFIDKGRVEKLEEKCVEYSKKPSSYYRLIK